MDFEVVEVSDVHHYEVLNDERHQAQECGFELLFETNERDLYGELARLTGLYPVLKTLRELIDLASFHLLYKDGTKYLIDIRFNKVMLSAKSWLQMHFTDKSSCLFKPFPPTEPLHKVAKRLLKVLKFLLIMMLQSFGMETKKHLTGALNRFRNMPVM